MDELTCGVEGCGRPVRVVARGWCAMHYRRWQTHGETGPAAAHRVHAGPTVTARRCEFPGCTRKYMSRGLCASHNWQRDAGRELTALPDRRHAKPHDRNPQGEEQCRTCLAWLSPDMFNRNARAKDGLQGHCRSCARDAQRKALYKLPPGRYAEMLASQGGTCAICGRPDGEGRALSVDHDHGCCPDGDRTCGKCVRGLVCGACNHGLGKFRDSPELLRAAAAYLERHASQ
ncbi:endonuclease VII domain-containing protein [Streptomyces lavendulocolor]|uniref:endonuclease VII domain-containing protein n=1 Tax=Streptomyces lavendulocolor TaxID=67316 RepID=UPI003C2ECC7F